MLEKELEYYIKHQKRFVAKYNGKFLVIKDQKLVGVYESIIDAYSQSSKQHKLGTFLIQRCGEGKENYTQTFHSRVTFNK